jgi:gamma-glutamyltranspeptidase / glutathione hydrolase
MRMEWCLILTASLACAAQALDLSPARWPAAERDALERQEANAFSPASAQVVHGAKGFVSATVSPVAVRAGVEALRQGGSAADAAATTALTQISMQLGSVVSYAGIFTLVYYDAATHKVYSLDGGYNTYLNERDPRSIPVGDLGPLNGSRKPTVGGAKGRETLVGGFMAGLEAMHKRFGRLPFKELFAPAIWYDEHGVVVSKQLKRFFDLRQKFLQRTAEGRAFLAQAGGETPEVGARFVQGDLAKTLQSVAEHGAQYMYTGRWAQDFVRIVQREGGAVTAEDLARYRPIWSEPYRGEAFGDTLYVNGPPNWGAYYALTGMNLAEALELQNRGPYWSDPLTFQGLTRIEGVLARAPKLSTQVVSLLEQHHIDPADQLSKAYAAQLAPLLGEVYAPRTEQSPHHSNAIVVVDARGNIAAVTHTINAVIWGDTGIVVDGVPIPDSAAFQQTRIADLKGGERLQHEIIDVIALSGEHPVLAIAGIGASLIPEAHRILLGALGQHQDLKTLMAAPPLIANLDLDETEVPLDEQVTSIVKDAYSAEFLKSLGEAGVHVIEIPTASAAGLRGTYAAVAIDASSQQRSGADQPGVMVFNAAQ